MINKHTAPNFIFEPTSLESNVPPIASSFSSPLQADRTLDQKKSFYNQVANELHSRLRVRRKDVFKTLVPVDREDWSFGNGEASLLEDR